MFSLAFVLLAAQAEPLAAKAPDGYQLVWSDEFQNTGAPNRKYWAFEEGFRRNHELQWYQAGNATCDGEYLIIEGRRETLANPHHDPHSRSWRKARPTARYTSASLITHEDHSWTYGRFEVRAKIKAQPGLWPAIWTTGIGPWPQAGEIDLMEYYDSSILANVAWAGEKGGAQWDDSKIPLTELGGEDWDQHFHIWSMEWTPEKIVLSVDGVVLNETLLKDTKGSGKKPDSPFHHPQRLRLNLAIGGDRGGNPAKTAFPTQYLVDYVRIYQKPASTEQAQ